MTGDEVDHDCPICGAGHATVYLDERGAGRLTAGAGSSDIRLTPGRILRCSACRVGYRSPRPSEYELAELYRHMDDSLYESESLGRMKTARRHLAIVHGYRRGSSLIDVGCGSGIFLSAAAEREWEVTGVDPSAAQLNHARARVGSRGRFLAGTLSEVEIEDESVDVVTAWDVLEHSNDPVAFVRRCQQALRPGGYAFFNVPDLNSLPARILSSRWPLLLAYHLFYFTRTSLLKCLGACDLQPVVFGRRPAHFSLDYLLLRLSQHRLPGSNQARRLLPRRVAAAVVLPLPLGELYVVARKPTP